MDTDYHRNLIFVSKETREKVKAVLNNDSIHYFAKNIIADGLDRDCLDAYYDVKIALECLELVLNDVNKG